MSDIRVFKSESELSLAATRLVVAAAQSAIALNGRFLIALSGGSSPIGLFQLLSQPPDAGRIDWEQTHVFWGDERLVPPSDPGNNYNQAAGLLLRHVAIPPANIHRVLGEADAATAVTHYIDQLQQLAEPGRNWPRFDLAIMGLGSDGHTASLFPGPIPPAETSQPVMAATADYGGRPAHRITLTPQVFNDAHHLLYLVMGAKKAEAVRAVLRGPQDPEKWPAQRIDPHDGQITWLLDEAAAGLLET